MKYDIKDITILQQQGEIKGLKYAIDKLTRKVSHAKPKKRRIPYVPADVRCQFRR